MKWLWDSYLVVEQLKSCCCRWNFVYCFCHPWSKNKKSKNRQKCKKTKNETKKSRQKWNLLHVSTLELLSKEFYICYLVVKMYIQLVFRLLSNIAFYYEVLYRVPAKLLSHFFYFFVIVDSRRRSTYTSNLPTFFHIY